MKKTITLLMIALVAISGVFAQGGSEKAASSSSEKTTLTFWSEFATPERTEYVERMAKLFEESHPNVKVEVTSLPDKAASKILTAYQAGQGPDVFLSSGPAVTDQIGGDYIIPLDKYFDSSSLKNIILPSALDTVREYDATGKGQLYYIPNGISVTTFWLRADWLKEAGYPNGISTWEDFFDAVVKMTDKSAGKYGLAIRGGAGGAKFLDRMMYSYSGIDSIFIDGKCTINDPKNVEFVERYLGLYGKCTAEGDLNYGWTELSAAFDSGSAGAIIHNLGSADAHEKAFNGDLSKFSSMGMPLNSDGVSMNLMLQPGGMTISSTCKNPDIAWEFVEFMSQGAPVDEYCQLFGVIPVDQNVLNTSEWIQAKPWYKNAAELLLNPTTKFYRSYANLPGKNKVYTKMDELSQFVMIGQMSAKEMLDQWAEAYQKAYDAWDYAGK